MDREQIRAVGLLMAVGFAALFICLCTFGLTPDLLSNGFQIFRAIYLLLSLAITFGTMVYLSVKYLK